jgi:hypothetical protein
MLVGDKGEVDVSRLKNKDWPDRAVLRHTAINKAHEPVYTL